MAETANVAEAAQQISQDIFGVFRWSMHPKRDENYVCHNESHVNEKGGRLSTHPCDVVFNYVDPYLARRIYLSTDLKSYGKQTISSTKMRQAIRSLALATGCATTSTEWLGRYADASEAHEVRGMLFVFNHDHKYVDDFEDMMSRIVTEKIPLGEGQIIHIMGPERINILFNIATDIHREISQYKLPRNYGFFYPDLVMWKCHGQPETLPATIEMLCSPFVIIKHAEVLDESNARSSNSAGYLIYYMRLGDTVEEFEYFLDCLSRYQILGSGQKIRIKTVNPKHHSDIKSHFYTAGKKYCATWGLDKARSSQIESIEFDIVSAVQPNYSPAKFGWRI